jgi:hypothetical protein
MAVANTVVVNSGTRCFTTASMIRPTLIAAHAAMLQFSAGGIKAFPHRLHFMLTVPFHKPPNRGSSRVRAAVRSWRTRHRVARIATKPSLLKRREPGSSRMHQALPKVGNGKALGWASIASSLSIAWSKTTGAMLLPNLSLNPDASQAALARRPLGAG